MEDIIKLKDEEIVELLSDNRKLNEELTQCQNDKEFVWSLWKRLQVSSPDLTQAISVVMQREKEKSETKDRKVLEIFQTKDAQLENMQSLIETLKQEREKLIQMNRTLEESQGSLVLENEELKNRNEHLVKQLQDVQTNTNQSEFGLKQKNNALTVENDDLATKLTKCRHDLQMTSNELDSVHSRLDDVKAKLSQSDDENARLFAKCDQLKQERETLSDEVIKLRGQLTTTTKTCEACRKSSDACNILKLQNEQQKNVIIQLQDLNAESQKVLNDQENSRSQEITKLKEMFSSLGRKYDVLKNKHERLKQQNQTRDSNQQRASDLDEFRLRMESQQDEIAMLRRRLSDNDDRRSELQDFTFSPIIERKHKRTRSVSPTSSRSHQVSKRLQIAENKLEQMRNLLQLKKEELSEILSAHNRRLDRLKVLQQNYRLLKDKGASRGGHASSMRHENSDGVWNELEKCKRENRTLANKRLQLEESLDVAKVQSAMDRATAQELRICLEQERHDLENKLKKSSASIQRNSTPIQKSHHDGSERPSSALKQLVNNLQQKNEKMEHEGRSRKKEVTQMRKEAKVLKDEIKTLKQELTDNRLSSGDMRRELSTLRDECRHLEDAKVKLKLDMKSIEREAEDHRRSNDVIQNENISMRQENCELRRELTVLRNEMRGIDNMLKQQEKTSRELSSGMSSQRQYRMTSDNDDVDSLGEDIVRVSTSPRKENSSKGLREELLSLSLRFSALQEKCDALMHAKEEYDEVITNQSVQLSAVQKDNENLQRNANKSKQSINKLHKEMDVLSSERDELRRIVDQLKSNIPMPQKHTDSDYKILEVKHKSIQQELITSTHKVKRIEKELEEREDAMAAMKEKMIRLERDVTMKRQLVEEQRTKVKTAEQNTKSDQETMLDLEERIAACTEDLQHKKSYVDSLKRQVQMLTREKAQYEEMFNKATQDADKKSQQLLKEQSRRSEAEQTSKTLEENIEIQLHEIATRSEFALDTMKEELSRYREKNNEFNSFVKILSNEILDLTKQLKQSILHQTQAQENENRSSESPSMNRAKSLACSILNMSQADFDDLMTPVDGRKSAEPSHTRADAEWRTQVDDMMNETPPFAKSLNRLLWDKIHDAVQLAEEKCRLQAQGRSF